MKLLLICSGGMSTQILISSLEKEAKKLAIENFLAVAIGANEMEEYNKDFDVVLVAPQIRHKFDNISDFATKHKRKVYQIAMTEYNPIGAAKLLKNVKKLMEE